MSDQIPSKPLNQVLSDALTHLIVNWKTTVSSILTTITAAGFYFAAVPTAVLQQNGISQKVIFWGTCVVGIAKVFLGMIQNDAKQ
jgi:hypothetical protein